MNRMDEQTLNIDVNFHTDFTLIFLQCIYEYI